ncbi:MAG: aspartate kinase [Endozoicomonadaceae bacterium]|nr:aspartate kinase [Endozoicomonadaceae bacterium]
MLLVQKFGGTSLGNLERIDNIAKKIKKNVQEDGHQIIVVVSAMANKTDQLHDLCLSIDQTPNIMEYDAILATGEQITASLLAIALNKINCHARSANAFQIGIETNNAYGKARIRSIKTNQLLEWLKTQVVIVTGFQGVSLENKITTLGRGGSDTSAVALAAAIQAHECQIYTDVDGVYTTDPNIVTDAQKITRITFEEMLEMSSQGSKVLQTRSVEFATKYGVQIRVSHAVHRGIGTLITFDEGSGLENPVVSAISFSRHEARITVRKIHDKPGIAAKILQILAKKAIEVDMIVQSVSQQDFTDLTFTVPENSYNQTITLLNTMQTQLKTAAIEGDHKIAKISIIGIGMRSHAGVAATMFEALALKNINIQAITTSEIKVSVLIEDKYLELAIRLLHAAFKLENSQNNIQ